MAKSGPVNVAMIGLGWWGKKMTAVLQKAGVTVLHDLPVRVVGIMRDTTAEREAEDEY